MSSIHCRFSLFLVLLGQSGVFLSCPTSISSLWKKQANNLTYLQSRRLSRAVPQDRGTRASYGSSFYDPLRYFSFPPRVSLHSQLLNEKQRLLKIITCSFTARYLIYPLVPVNANSLVLSNVDVTSMWTLEHLLRTNHEAPILLHNIAKRWEAY